MRTYLLAERATTGAQTMVNWVTAISPGPANESAQTLSFTVTTENPGLLTTPPGVSPAGTLTFTPHPAGTCNASVLVVLKDSGGVDNSARTPFTAEHHRCWTETPLISCARDRAERMAALSRPVGA